MLNIKFAVSQFVHLALLSTRSEMGGYTLHAPDVAAVTCVVLVALPNAVGTSVPLKNLSGIPVYFPSFVMERMSHNGFYCR
jgi:hypothetical protein